MPDLNTYDASAVIIWLFHYDDIFADDPPLGPGGLSVADVPIYPEEFQHFTSHLARFSGTERSFLLRLWVGDDAAATTTDDLDRSLRTLSVP